MQSIAASMMHHKNRAQRLLINSLVITTFCLTFIFLLRRYIETRQTPEIFWNFLIIHDYWGAWLFVFLLLSAFAARNTEHILSVVGYISNRPNTVAFVAFVAFCAGTLCIYRNHPLSMDEYSMRLQSEIFANGHLTGKYPVELIDWLIPSSFQSHFFVVSRDSGNVITAYMPGFALLLTPFSLLGIPWACNPAISALSLLALHKLAQHTLSSPLAGGWAVLFALASPVFTINAISYYSMPAHLLLNLGFSLLLLQPTPRKAFAAGLVGGLALVLHNPLPHALFAIPWVAWLLYRREFRLVGALVLGYLPPVICLGAGWIVMASSVRSSAALGNDVNAAGAMTGSALQAWIGIVKNTLTVPDPAVLLMRLGGTIKLWLWAAPGLLLLAALGFRAHRKNTVLRLFLACAVLTYLGYFLIPVSQGHGWGYRYFHSAWGVLPIMAAAAVTLPAGTAHSSSRLIAVAGYLALSSMLFATGLRLYQVNAFISSHLNQIPRIATNEPTVTFVEINAGYYMKDLIQNEPTLRNKHITMLSQGKDENLKLIKMIDLKAEKIESGAWGERWKTSCQLNRANPCTFNDPSTR